MATAEQTKQQDSSTHGDTSIEVNGVSKFFGELAAVNDLTFTVEVSLATVKLAAPEKGDEVKVLSGADKDSVGSLLSVDEGDGIVRVKATGEVKFFSLKNLAKLHKN